MKIEELDILQFGRIIHHRPSTMSTFDEFWSAYPRRKGANPKHPASLKFATAVKNGADPSHIVESARRYADELKKQGKLNTEFVCMAQTWLNQKRWMDYAPDAYEEKKFEETKAKMAAIGWIWTGERWVDTKKPPREAEDHSPDANVTS